MLKNGKDTIGLVLVDHGSKLQAANDLLLDVAALFKRVSGEAIVEPAHMEICSPTIEDAFDACVAQGATLILVHPYFLAPGKHSTRDIPRMTAAAAARHPHVRYHVTQPLGLDEKIAQVTIERMQHCISAGFECDYCREIGGCSGGSKERETAPERELTAV